MALRVFTVLALCFAAAAALPASATEKTNTEIIPRPVTTITNDDFDDGAWFSFPLFGNLFAPLWRLFPSFADIGPKIVSDDDNFKIIVNVKEYKKEDLKVKIKGFLIFVQGVHVAKTASDVFDRQFFHTYTLPVNASGADVTADLSSDGFLIVNFPLKGSGKKNDDLDMEVPIIETGTPYVKDEENNDKTEAVAPAVPAVPVAPVTPAVSSIEEDDRKEPTTPASDKELITEKDNIIPHGSDEELP